MQTKSMSLSVLGKAKTERNAQRSRSCIRVTGSWERITIGFCVCGSVKHVRRYQCKDLIEWIHCTYLLGP